MEPTRTFCAVLLNVKCDLRGGGQRDPMHPAAPCGTSSGHPEVCQALCRDTAGAEEKACPTVLQATAHIPGTRGPGAARTMEPMLGGLATDLSKEGQGQPPARSHLSAWMRGVDPVDTQENRRPSRARWGERACPC